MTLLLDYPAMDASVVRRPPFGSNPLVGVRGTDTRRRILGAALDSFAEVGFAETRVELITARAGCSRPAFYQYFSSKDDVFWALAAELGRDMVAHADRLERVTPDRDGVEHLTEWVGGFMALHEAWAPVFASFQAASRGHEPQARRSAGIADRTGAALLRAFDVADTPATATLVSNLVSVLIRCSFYAEQVPADTDARPLGEAIAHLLHRTIAGPADGVNVVRRRPTRRRGVPIPPPEPQVRDQKLRARGERTRGQLLAAGAAVLPVRGYHDARVDDIVAAAGLSHGTFYRYFDNKDDFVRVLAEDASARTVALLDRADLAARPDELRAWLRDWLHAYRDSGGVISTWLEMRTSDELRAFARRMREAVFIRLVGLLEPRHFGNPVVDATALLALVERVPYSVYALGFTTEDDAVENMVITIRRGFLACG
jgi:AcrR family transcriptional regulator